ncbi:hypothetical protein QQS21_000273 [Conoideocrella luteorostrata]|uniref:cyclin-dependent kinase n=1 Tax=Conoideocrella luteorostrata TaxID=1105319 RepID=A0AAJ0FZH0_9HYPO|nr:hypothetical protein QQS21_000273 [Conoideocrella luteorostrata]
MAAAWKTSLSILDRYTNIQTLQASLPEERREDAIAIEQDAYQNSYSRHAYDAALASHAVPLPPQPSTPDTEKGIAIGTYHNCTPIAQGVTSEVYRSSAYALKVIVAHRNLEPHNPQREASILTELHSLLPPPGHIIQLIETFRDQEQRFVLVFPYLPLTLDAVLSDTTSALPTDHLITIFTDVLNALVSVHEEGVIHRDIKPSAVLLQSPSGPAYLSDFGTAWHPRLSAYTESPTDKVLDIGTGAYRAPEVLFANKAYGPPVDIWALGIMLAQAITSPPKAPFESRPVHEDGNQLGLILSIFKTLGTPTEETWPEAKSFKVSPFELWTVFPQRSWDDVLPAANADFRDIVGKLVCFESGNRLTATEVGYAHGWMEYFRG